MSEGKLIDTPCTFGENGNFLLERELGAGGMGGVYMGRDKMLDRPVAVKVMLREYGSDPEFVEKFKREAQAAARLIHPNIAQIYSYGISDGMPYIAMELVAGGSLDKLMANSPGGTDVPRVMKICEQVAQALRCAADQGLVHGDVKPENVLLDANGNAKLVDFGLAAMQKDTDEIWGTPYYIAPEKVRKQPVDYRADMYSLGGTIYHALTGVAPFEGEDANAVVRKRFDGAPKPPSQVRPGLSPQIDYLVLKMLALDPADRYPSFEALLEDFKKVMASGLSASQNLASAAPSAAHSAPGGGRKLSIKPRRKFAVKKPSVSLAAAAGDEPEPHAAAAADDGDDEEEEGGVGGKVALVIGGIVGAIALVAGGLYGLKVMNEKGNAAHDIATIERNIDSAVKSLAHTRETCADYRGKIDKMSEELGADCRKVSKDVAQVLRSAYPDEIVAMLEVPKTAELIAAEKALLAPAEAPEAPAAPAAPAALATEVTSAITSALATVSAAAPAQVSVAVVPQAPAAEAAPAVEVPPIVNTVRELWEKTYAAQAAALRVRKRLLDLERDIEAAMSVGERNAAEMERLAKATTAFTSVFDSIKASQDITTLQKAKGSVKDRGEKALKKAKTKLREETLRKEREEAKKRKAEEEKAEKERLAEERAKKVGEETAAAAAKFDALCAAGNMRQLDWEGAKRQLKSLKSSMETGEGEVAVAKQLKKVEMMESVHKILVRNMKGYEFTRGTPRPSNKGEKQAPHLKGMTVVSVDAKTIVAKMQGAPSAQQKRIPWQTFYRDYHANFGEVCNRFIFNGRRHGSPKLKLREQSDALLGVALTMQIVCAADESAAMYGDAAAKAAVKVFPENMDVAKELFPNIDFTAIEKAAEAENL